MYGENRVTSISFRLTEEEKEKIVEYAKSNDITISQAIRKLCKSVFKESEKNE